jgi:hypothetical protein
MCRDVMELRFQQHKVLKYGNMNETTDQQIWKIEPLPELSKKLVFEQFVAQLQPQELPMPVIQF